MECGNKGVKDIGSLFVHGRAIGADDAVGLGTFGCPKAARDFLFHLWHTHGLFGQVVGERHTGLGHKTPDIIAVIK